MAQDFKTAGVNDSPSQPDGIKSELASDAKTIGKAAQDRFNNKAGEGKDQATQVARSTSQALGKAVEELRNDEATPAWLTSAFEKSSRAIEQFAGSIEGKDVQTIGRDIGGFARQSPMAFLAASAAAGFAAARVLRAGGDYREHGGADSPQANTGMTDGSGSNANFGSAEDRSSFTWANESGPATTRLEGIEQ